VAGRPAEDPKGWLVTVAWRKFLDAARADTSRRQSCPLPSRTAACGTPA
jgi:DNA-directed RNA polymerase specialized sigma24 family protein